MGKASISITAAMILPAALVLAAGCRTLIDRGTPLVPGREQVRTGPFVVYANTPLKPQSVAVRCLAELERDFQNKLGGADQSGEPVQIYVLDDREAFAHFLQFYYPELPMRRAFFLARDRQRLVYTYNGTRLEEDLRHEAAHALVRGSYGDLPLWLDEGLAEYFENDLARPALLKSRADRLMEDMAGGLVPSMERLETLTDIHQMTPRDYREAWGWVHLLLEGPEERRLRFRRVLEDQAQSHGSTALAVQLARAGANADVFRANLVELQSRISAANPVELGRPPLLPPLFGR